MEDLESFRYADTSFGLGEKRTIPKRKRVGTKNPFIRGPIPMAWLTKAANLPRRNALLVGLMLFHLAGLRSEHIGLVLCVERCKPFGLGRKAVQRGLVDLESVGLIRVDRASGRCPRVDILDLIQQT